LCAENDVKDWLNKQFDEMEATVTELGLGRDWLMQMGQAARNLGLTLQYCMSPSRHALQTLEIPVVSQVFFLHWSASAVKY
jgi:hypothetical protein